MPEAKPPVQLRSDEVQDILSAVPVWMIRWGSTLIFILLLGILFLSWLIKYPDTVTGEAVITTVKEPVYLYAKASGNLANLYVEENELVVEGQLLAEVNSPVQKEQIDYLQQKLKEVDFFVNGNTKAIVFEAEEPSFGEIQANYNQLKGSINDFKQLQSSYYQSSIGRLKANIGKYKQLTEIYDQKLGIARRELTNAEQKFKAAQRLYEEKVIAGLELLEKESGLNQRRMEVQSLKQALVQNELSLASLEKELAEQLFSQEEASRKLRASILSEKKIVENFILSWKQGSAITAPSKGRVTFIEKFSEGHFVKTDKPLLAIIPVNEEFLAKVKVPSSRYGKIKEGQKVQFALDNYPFQEYGYFYGTIHSKSFIPVEKAYELIIKLPPELVSSYGKEIEYKPNMVATADIIIEDQRLLEKLFYSFRKLLN